MADKFTAQRSEIDWQTPNFGVFDPPRRAGGNPLQGRFGAGAGPLQAPGDGKPGENGSCDCEGKVGLPLLYEDGLDADTETGALEEWVDLPGLERTIAVDRPSVAWVHAHVVARCVDEGLVADAECRIRIVVNGEPTSGETRESITPAFMTLPGLKLKSVRTLPCQCAFRLTRGVNYTYKVQIANFIAATTYEALVGSGGGGTDSNMFMLLVKGNVEGGDVEPPPATEGNSWMRVLGHTIQQDDQTLMVARVRGEFDTGTPTADGTPDRAYLEVAVGSTTLLNFPLSSVLSGLAVRWKKPIDPAFWTDYWCQLFECNHDGKFALGYSRDKAGPTAYSQEYELVLVSKGGSTLRHDAWNGPNWLEAAANNNGSKYGSAVFDVAGVCWVCIPTTDTTNKSAGSPYKSGWRLANLTTSGITNSNDIAQSGGAAWRMPIAVLWNGSVAAHVFVELVGITQTIYWQDMSGMSGGTPPGDPGTAITLGGIRPATGQALKVYDTTQIDGLVYMMIQNGYGAVLTWNDWEPTVETWNDALYNADPEYDWVMLPISSHDGNGKAYMFRRGAEGGVRDATDEDQEWMQELEFNQ